MKVAIIGGGAAGFFAAISCKIHNDQAQVTIFEKTSKLLAKVKVSGGGRCNVTHACFNASQLSKFYPRGEKQLRKAFGTFSTSDTVKWFEERGVQLKTETDNRMFPVTDDSQTIIDCLQDQVRRLGIKVITSVNVDSIVGHGDTFVLHTSKDDQYKMDKVVITTGGSPKPSGFKWLADLGHEIEPPVPSLFTFNMPNEAIKQLMGLTVQNVSVRLQGSKLKEQGPLLITHWGMSGPAILKLSAFGARVLHDLNYNFGIQVNWLSQSEDEVRSMLAEMTSMSTKRKIVNKNPFHLPNRLWEFLIEKIGLRSELTWGELGSKGLNKLINVLINDIYKVQGKTTFKEEFVTCGGVSLKDVDFQTMQSRKLPGMYFAGEVLDVDGVTGGFNFQAAWTTGFIAGRLQ